MKVQDYDPVVDQVTAVAEDASGNAQMLKVNAQGKLMVDSNIDLTGTTVNISGDIVADVNTIEQTLGATTDAAASADTGTFSFISLQKRLLNNFTLRFGSADSAAATTDTASSGFISLFKRLLVTKIPDSISGRIPVNVTFPTTQPVSATSLPLPTGAASETTLETIKTAVELLDNAVSGNTFIARVSDGTTAAAIKAASTPAVTTDAALVVAIHPASNIVSAGSPSFSLTEVTGTAQATSTTELAAFAARKYLFIQNLSTAAIHVSFGGTASTATLRIDAGGSLVFEGGAVPTNAVNIIRTTAGQNFYIAHA